MRESFPYSSIEVAKELLVTMNLGHVQLDGFSTFYCLRYAMSFVGKIACGGTACKIPPLERGASAPIENDARSSGVALGKSNKREVYKTNKSKKA